MPLPPPLSTAATLRWFFLLVTLALLTNNGNGLADAKQTSGTPLVFGLGPALVAVIVLGIACMIICAVGYSAQNNVRFLIPVIVIIGGTALFFVSVKIDDTETSSGDATMKYNRVAVARSAVGAILITFTVLSCFSLLLMHVIKPRQGHLIGEPAVGQRRLTRVF